TRGLFWDGPRSFEPWSDDEDDAWDGTPSPNFRVTPTGGCLAARYDLACNRPHTRSDLQWNLVSNLEPSGPKVETLPLGHRCFATARDFHTQWLPIDRSRCAFSGFLL
ncbi:hypothetical protein AVEN_273658-1, partial [Araneus ventricosus]